MIIWQDKDRGEKIDALTRLVPKKQFELLTLDHLCREHDGTFSRAETEAGMKPDRHFRSFFLYYEGKRLTGELFIFPISDNKAEITAIVDPHCRRKGIFTGLLQAAEEELEKYGIDDYVFVAEPGCEAADAVRAHLNAETVRSELTMELPETVCEGDPYECGIGNVSVEYKETGAGFDAVLSKTDNGEMIGIAHVCMMKTSAFIYGVEINEQLRGRGLGKMLMRAVIGKLVQDNPGIKIMLQVSSDNTAAVALYKGLGFVTASVLDYLKCPPKLKRLTLEIISVKIYEYL